MTPPHQMQQGGDAAQELHAGAQPSAGPMVRQVFSTGTAPSEEKSQPQDQQGQAKARYKM